MLLNTSEVHEDVEREFTKNSSLFHIFRDPLRHMPTDFSVLLFAHHLD